MANNKLIILKRKAIQFREKNGISHGEPIRIKSLLIKLNILTVYKPLSENFSGMALKANEDQKFILVNSNHSLGRQHFTIAHELYHLFVQENFTPHQCSTGRFDKKKQEEYDADYFASFLLMPDSGIIDIIPEKEITSKNISINTVIKLEQYYSVSHASLLLRLKFLKLITEKQYESFRNLRIIRTAVQYGYDTSLYKKGNQDLIISDYGKKAMDLFENEQISEGHYYELMNIIGFDTSKIINGNED